MTADRGNPAPSSGAENIPSPRPEILARVLERLRDLPAERSPRAGPDEIVPDDARAAGVPEALLPLPRRRS